MIWTICFILGAFFLFSSLIGAFIKGKSKYKSGRILEPSNIIFMGVILSAITLFIPVYINTFKTTDCGIFETIFISIHNMIRLFIVDGEFEFITANLVDAPAWLVQGYTRLFAFIFVLAPLLTFGFVLSFFKNISAYKRYIQHYRSDAFIFSELNEKSLSLAKSLYTNNPKGRFFVFTDVFEKDEEQSYELIEQAKELGAICFKKDIVTIDFSLHSKKSQLNFFTIGEDQSENINQSLKIISNSKYGDNANLYVFSTQIEAEMLLAHAFNEGNASGVKVRRVNEVQSLINRTLYDYGHEKIFETAYTDKDGIKKINAVIVGMGQHGTEMTKALSWFCQMDGYQVEINSFDIDSKAESKFISLCPELMDEDHNNHFDIDGEAKYNIKIHSGIDVDTKQFDDIVLSLPQTTYVFVALGNDEKNISVSVKLRALFEQNKFSPAIQAVVYNTDKKEALTDIKNFKGQEYKIDFIGDMKSSYSENVILDLEVEEAALARHLKWGNEKDFWQYDYNYKSSIASAIHYRMKVKCNIPGIEKKNPADRTEEELWAIRKLEHCRWNAYMRSEGYVFSGNSQDKTTRNDLAKVHHCLVKFDDLLPAEKEKDDD